MARSDRAIPEEDIGLRQAALAYVIELYDELTEENGAPTLGTQNQAVDFILADPERAAVADWAAGTRSAKQPPHRRGACRRMRSTGGPRLPGADHGRRRCSRRRKAAADRTRADMAAAALAPGRPISGRGCCRSAELRKGPLPCRASTSFPGSTSPRSTTRSPASTARSPPASTSRAANARSSARRARSRSWPTTI